MMFDEVSDVQAPVGALGWSVSTGWITDPGDLLSAQQHDVVLVADDDGVVRNVPAVDVTLAALMHVDRRLVALRRELDERNGDGDAPPDRGHIAARAGRPA